MPLTEKGEKIKKAMSEQYGKKKGEQVFYASANKGNITGVHHDSRDLLQTGDVPQAPPPVEPPTLATSPQPQPKVASVSTDSGGFKLPEAVSHSEIKSASRKYGGW